MNIIKIICDELNVKLSHGENVQSLIADGNTIPFIARYRKEQTGSMDDQVLRKFAERLEYLNSLMKRKEEVIKSISDQEKLTDEIEKELESAITLSKVEDIYRPFKPKRTTRASIAKEKGLEPLADFLLEQKENGKTPLEEAEKYVSETITCDDAISGAQDIIAEMLSDNPKVREVLRNDITKTGAIQCTKSKDDDSVYSDYYDFSQPLSSLPPHRILAIDRGEKEGFLKVSVLLEKETFLTKIKRMYIKNTSSCKEYIENAIEDGYGRLLFPSMERESRNVLSDKAVVSAISVFSENLKNLLLQPPVAGKVTLAIDPAFRTGCKIAVVDEIGLPLATNVIYPTPPQNKVAESEKTILAMLKKYNVDIIAIGNGTASRESEQFAVGVIKKYKSLTNKSISYIIVNEAGASVYSASKLGAKEFPNYDVSLRSAISIARRLQDPLAELVKIDPKSIGVGQYQHDMPKNQLENALGGVVESCVNSVGINLNTASPSLLSYVSGINKSTAESIVTYRDEVGRFKNRKDLLKVPKLGPKAYKQCAGFLRINGDNILDNTGVHPESYDATKQLLSLCDYTIDDVSNGDISDLHKKISNIGPEKVCNDINIGYETLKDIVLELLRPGRDPREDLEKPLLRSDVMEITDLLKGMKLKGTVRNVIDFGAFVDIGVHQDGLVHISQISNKFIKHPSDVLKVGDIVDVLVLDVDIKKGRIALTMKLNEK